MRCVTPERNCEKDHEEALFPDDFPGERDTSRGPSNEKHQQKQPAAPLAGTMVELQPAAIRPYVAAQSGRLGRFRATV